MTTSFVDRALAPGARHELKHRLDAAEADALARRLRRVLPYDAHGGEHGYRVTSLYFDTPYDEALLEKLNGASRREKFRLRYYGTDTSRVRLERKSKVAGLGFKLRAELTREQAERLVAGDADVLLGVEGEAASELRLRMRTRLLRPRTVVAYDRLAFSYAPGNVRVTIDTRLRAGMGAGDFWRPDALMLPVDPGLATLEVKWDRFLPDVVVAAVQLSGRRHTSHSKYAACRRHE